MYILVKWDLGCPNNKSFIKNKEEIRTRRQDLFERQNLFSTLVVPVRGLQRKRKKNISFSKHFTLKNDLILSHLHVLVPLDTFSKHHLRVVLPCAAATAPQGPSSLGNEEALKGLTRYTPCVHSQKPQMCLSYDHSSN